MSKPSEQGERIALLPRSNLARRFVEMVRTDPDLPERIHAVQKEMAKFDARLGDASVEQAAVKVEAAAEAKRRRGRPKTPKPWDGVCSKAAWYRRLAKPPGE